MKIEKNKLVNRAQVLNQDIQLGIIAYSVAEMASIIEQTDAKLNKGEINDEQHKAIVDDCVEYIKSAKEVCDESKMDWSVCILLSRTNLDKYVESKVDLKARLTKVVFLLMVGYLGWQCTIASLWIPLVLCVLLGIFIIRLKNKDLA